MLLAGYVFNELSYDKDLPGVDQIFRLSTKKGITSFKGDLTDVLKERYPEIEKLCRYENEKFEIVYDNNPLKVENVVLTDNDFSPYFQ
ncbi:MAG: hypothetical protein HC905_30420 [Bacteroidales bacterium]|nr:hypothetical protein [Bacteroidales bacterium]